MILPKFDSFWKVFKETPGALSSAEALSIMQLASLVEGNKFIELGVNRGKSALAASQALPEGDFFLVEPEFSNNDWCREVVNKVFRNANNHISPKAVADYSTNIIERHSPYAYVFVDSGSHGDGLPMQEAKLLEDGVIEGGVIAFHDFGNQFREPKEAAEYLVGTGKYEWIHIDWQPIFNYVKEHDLENGNNSWHLYPELPHPPNFVGALKRI